MATIVRRDPFRELERLATSLLPSAAPAVSAPIDVLERDGALIVRLDVPGIAREDLDVKLHGRRLVVSGERKAEEAREGDRYWHFERTHGAFRRVVPMPAGVQEQDVTASLIDGVLEIRVPLPQAAQPKQIQIA
jgi:HSP20 family protein